MNATISETGIVSITINVALQSSQEKKYDQHKNIAAYISVSVRLLIESL